MTCQCIMDDVFIARNSRLWKILTVLKFETPPNCRVFKSCMPKATLNFLKCVTHKHNFHCLSAATPFK